MSDSSVSGFRLRHEMFVLDAHLEQSLDQSQMESTTNRIVDALLSALGMEKLGPLEMYPAADMRAPGWSFIQPITTSHIAAHYFEKPGRDPHIRMDIYSCESVDWRKVIEVLHDIIDLKDWRASFIDRQIEGRDHRKVYDIKGMGNQILVEKLLVDEDVFSSMEAVKSCHLEEHRFQQSEKDEAKPLAEKEMVS